MRVRAKPTPQPGHPASPFRSFGRSRIFGAMFACLVALSLTACDEISSLVGSLDEATVASVEVMPEAADLDVGETQQFGAAAFDADGTPIPRQLSDFTWTSSDEGVASVNSTGEVTALSDGTATITATLDGQSGQATVAATSPEEEPDFGEWSFVLADTVVTGDVVVPDGEVWLIGPNVEVEGNVRTMAGTIAMRPGSSLKFLGADPEKYVGGGMTFTSEFADDIGLWIGHHGVLDIRGTRKQGWNRTGTHETWEPNDEYWISPTNVGDYSPRRWSPGEPIPQVDPRAPAAEVMNLTRDIVIEGPGHIHIHSQKPQRIEYVRLENLGVSREGGPVLGRYALHLHHGGDGTRGTIIRGVAAINNPGRVFVPHESHGITMIDNVSVNSWAEALWWDLGDHTNDIRVDRLAVSGVNFPRDVYGGTTRFDAVRLVSGRGQSITNSAVSGARGNRLSVGWHWNTQEAHRNPSNWHFENNIGHNNEGPGIRFWLNNRESHLVEKYIGYRNGERTETGAYGNPVRYVDSYFGEGMHWNANPRVATDEVHDGHQAGAERVRIESSEGPAISIGHRRLEADADWECIECELVGEAGHPKVLVRTHDRINPWRAHFVRSGVTPDDIAFVDTSAEGEQGTRILIDHEDGRRWEIRIENGKRIDREL